MTFDAYGPQNAAKIALAMGAAPPVQAGADLVMQPPPDTKPVKQRIRREHVEQVTLFGQIQAACYMGRPGANMIFAVPNGTASGSKVGAEMVKEGVRKGVPDIFVAVPRGPYHGLFVEIKLPGGVPSDLSQDQKDWLLRLSEYGYDTEVAFGWRHAWRVIREYLGWEDVI